MTFTRLPSFCGVYCSLSRVYIHKHVLPGFNQPSTDILAKEMTMKKAVAGLTKSIRKRRTAEEQDGKEASHVVC